MTDGIDDDRPARNRGENCCRSKAARYKLQMMLNRNPWTMPASNDDVKGRFFGKGVYPHQFAKSLLNPLRAIVLSRKTLIRRLGLTRGMTVLELGPGPGYFSIDVASAIAPGRLLLLDIQPEMLAMAARRLEAAGVTNFETHAGDARSLPFTDDSVDVAYMVTVLGEVTQAAACLGEIARVLKPQGLLSVSEARGDPDRLPEREVRAMAEAAGFAYERTFRGLLQYTINLRKPDPSPAREPE